jgi:hypothetical protein
MLYIMAVYGYFYERSVMLNFFRKCLCCEGMICAFCIKLTIAIMAIIFGMLIAWKPNKVIEIQIALYRLVNWKIEPISMEKEIRNTRIMGLIALGLGIVSIFYIW